GQGVGRDTEAVLRGVARAEPGLLRPARDDGRGARRHVRPRPADLEGRQRQRLPGAHRGQLPVLRESPLAVSRPMPLPQDRGDAAAGGVPRARCRTDRRDRQAARPGAHRGPGAPRAADLPQGARMTGLSLVPPGAVRVWRGFRLPDLELAQFYAKLGTVFVPATVLMQIDAGLQSYKPTVPAGPARKPDTRPRGTANLF